MNTKMKTLSLALVGLAGFGFAGAAAAGGTCPGSPSPPWTTLHVGGGASAGAVVAGGYDGTSCKFQSALGDNGNARAMVQDSTPADEPRYRAQFIFDPSNLAGTNGNEQAIVFFANTGTAVDGTLATLRVIYAGSGAGTKRLIFAASCNNGTTGLCFSQFDLPVPNGPNRIEVDLQTGANGVAYMDYWVSALATATTEASPSGSVVITGGNAARGGVEDVFLGMNGSTATYRSLNTGANTWFDQFDSRRTTFIGAQ